MEQGPAVHEGALPSQQQVRWAQLRVGVVVIVASITLAVLIFLMTGPTGLFTKKITLFAYFDNASGLRPGAPVRLEGVDIGNVNQITVVAHHGPNPVRVRMSVSTRYLDSLRRDSTAMLATAGVLGETFVDVDSSQATGAPVANNDTLRTLAQPDLQDVIRSSQGTLQNVDVLLKRLDRIVSFVENGQGTIGKLIYDEKLYDKLNTTLNQLQTLVSEVSQGKGSIGKLMSSDELYNKANTAIDNVNHIIDEMQSGQGTVGKLLKDPSLYNNANKTIAEANALMAGVNQGKGALGKFATDQEFARKLDATITRLAEITDKINSGQGTAAKFLSDPSIYNNADQMLVETRGLLQAIRENPKKYLTIRLRIF